MNATDQMDDRNPVKISQNLTLINKILVGMTQILDERDSMLERVGEEAYYDVKHIEALVS